MRTIKLVMLSIIFFSVISKNITAQKAVEYKMKLDYCRPARYNIHGNSYTFKIICDAEIKELFEPKSITKLVPFGKEFKTDLADISIEINIDKVYFNDSVRSKKATANLAAEYYNESSATAEYNFRIIDKEDHVLLNYDCKTQTRGTGSGLFKYASLDAAKANQKSDRNKNMPALYADIAKLIVSDCNGIIDTTISTTKKTIDLKLFSGKTSKFKYVDLDTALLRFKRGLGIYNSKCGNKDSEGLMYQSIEAWTKATKEFREGAKISRISIYNIGEIYLNLATAYFILGDYSKAKENIEKSLKFDTDNKPDKLNIKNLIEYATQDVALNEKFQSREKTKKTKLYTQADLNELVFAAVFDYQLTQNYHKSAYQMHYFQVNRRNINSIQQTIEFDSDPETEKTTFTFKNGFVQTIETEQFKKKSQKYDFNYHGKLISDVTLDDKKKFELTYNNLSQITSITILNETSPTAIWDVSYAGSDSVNFQLSTFEKNKKTMSRNHKSHIKCYNDLKLASRYMESFREINIEYTSGNFISRSLFDNPNLDRPNYMEFKPTYKLDENGNWIVQNIENGYKIKRSFNYQKF